MDYKDFEEMKYLIPVPWVLLVGIVLFNEFNELNKIIDNY